MKCPLTEKQRIRLYATGQEIKTIVFLQNYDDGHPVGDEDPIIEEIVLANGAVIEMADCSYIKVPQETRSPAREQEMSERCGRCDEWDHPACDGYCSVLGDANTHSHAQHGNEGE